MPKRMPFIVGNWKMNKGLEDTLLYLDEFIEKVKHTPTLKGRELCIAPTFTSLHIAEELLKKSSIKLCAQNVHWEASGQFTGEISTSMLKDLGVQYVIIGHSERRKYFAETSETVNLRVKASIRHKLHLIMCVGERREEREAGNTEKVVREHIAKGLSSLVMDDVLRYVTIAYEPVWAIGTGLNATVEQAVSVHKFIRGVLDEIFGANTSEHVRILYGGSVKPDNVDGFMTSEDIDGVLVGGASLDVDSFLRICDFR